MAAGILLVVVVAVTSAVTAGQQQALEAKQRIAGTLAAEELMGRLITLAYDTLPGWNGHTEACGSMTNVAGQPMPESFDGIGRDVQVTTSLKIMEDLDVKVRGRSIRVRAFEYTGRTLADITRFVPEPQS